MLDKTGTDPGLRIGIASGIGIGADGSRNSLYTLERTLLSFRIVPQIVKLRYVFSFLDGLSV